MKMKLDFVSFTHYIRFRYGIATYIITLLVILFNMCVLLFADYSAIGSVFKAIVDPQRVMTRPDVFIIIMVAGTVAIYTAVGGLKVSLITDLAQGVIVFIVLVIVIIFVAVTFRYPLTRERSDELGLRDNPVGRNTWGSTLVILLGNFYDESNWQRVWASKNTKTLILGSIFGGL